MRSEQIDGNKPAINWLFDDNAINFLNKHYESFIKTIDDHTLFNAIEWQRTAAEYLTKNRQFCLLLIYCDNRLHVCLPLTLGIEHFYKFPVHTIRLCGYPYSDRMVLPIKEPFDFALLYQAIAKCPAKFDLLIFDEILNKDVIHLKDALSHDFYLRIRHSTDAPVLNLNYSDLTEFENQYSKTLRTRLKRARNKQKKAGTIRYQRIFPRTQEELESCLSIITDIENQSWKGNESLGIFGAGQQTHFFREISKIYSKSGLLDISLLYLNDQVIAYRYGFCYKDIFLDYNLAHLNEFSNYSPGRVLLDEVIRNSIQSGYKAIDASRGGLVNRHILEDWSLEVIPHYVVWLYKKNLKGLIIYLAFKLRQRLKSIKA